MTTRRLDGVTCASAALAWTACVLATSGRVATAQCEMSRVLASDGAELDFFGASVSISGDVAVVGSPQDDDRGANSGSAYVYRRHDASWLEETKLLASDGQPGDFFGFSVSIRASVVVVGAFGSDGGVPASGAAYVYRHNGSSWNEEARLVASDGAVGDQFGRSVGMGSGVVVVGAPRADGDEADTGAAYVFRLIGESWMEDVRLAPEDLAGGDQFGHAVATAGTLAVVGAPFGDDGVRDGGTVFVFRDDGAQWVEEARLVAGDATTGAQLGWTVSVSGDAALVGANVDPENGSRSGAAYVYRRTGETWTQEAKLTPADAAPHDHFGHGVATDGTTALIGARWDDDNGYHAGSAYVFRQEGTTWAEAAKLLASDGDDEDKYGFAVGLGGRFGIVGAFANDERGFDSGAAYLIDLADEDCECVEDLDGNGTVDFADLLLLLAQWGKCPPVCLGDLDGDGTVDFRDLLALLAAWGPCE